MGHPRHHRFSLMWSNKGPYFDRHMGRHTFMLRDVFPVDAQTMGGDPVNGQSGWDIYLDQVYVSFNPPTKLTTALMPSDFRLLPQDNTNLTFDVETYELMIRFEPGGVRNVLYTEEQSDSNRGELVRNVRTPLHYSTVLYLNNVIAPLSSNAFNRCYRPLRDIPIAENVSVHASGGTTGGPITLELLWPLLQSLDPSVLSFVPDYRILTVLCDFSC